MPSVEERQRVLLPEEMLASLFLPVTDRFAARAGAPRVPIECVSLPQQARMAGNGMSLPAIGAIVLLAVSYVEVH